MSQIKAIRFKSGHQAENRASDNGGAESENKTGELIEISLSRGRLAGRSRSKNPLVQEKNRQAGRFRPSRESSPRSRQ